MSECKELCGCGMPCVEGPEELHREVGGELLHACGVHWPRPEKGVFRFSDDYYYGSFDGLLVLSFEQREMLQGLTVYFGESRGKYSEPEFELDLVLMSSDRLIIDFVEKNGPFGDKLIVADVVDQHYDDLVEEYGEEKVREVFFAT